MTKGEKKATKKKIEENEARVLSWPLVRMNRFFLFRNRYPFIRRLVIPLVRVRS